MLIIFDIGSNATKASLVRDGVIVRDWREKTGIGRHRLPDGSLRPEAFENQRVAIDKVIGEACGIARQDAIEMHAIGTEALRKAPNSGDFVRMLKDRYGIGLEIISGAEEAELEMIAVMSSRARLDHPDCRVLCIDSGGSSTEFSMIDGCGKVLCRAGYPFGQHDICRAVEEGLPMPFEQMFADLAGIVRAHDPELVIAAGSSFTAYAAWELGVVPFDADEVESRQVHAGASFPKDDRAAAAGSLMIAAFENIVKCPMFVTNRGIRHGWLKKNGVQ